MARDGFKKFLKTEQCPYERCRFSRICNHIHCVREACFYVLHSSGQLLSHKRKHDRIDSEQAYRRFKMAQKASSSASGTAPGRVSSPSQPAFDQLPADLSVSLTTSESLPDMNSSYSAPADLMIQIQQQQQLSQRRAAEAAERMDTQYDSEAIAIRTYFTDACPAESGLSHRPCRLAEGGITHLHCLLDSCPVRRTIADMAAHLQEHQQRSLPPQHPVRPAPVHQPNQQQQHVISIDGFFNRKRGRPPKNRVVEVYNNVSISIFRSSKSIY